ncbi:hypothetical protein LFT45_14465 [Arthrobacter sp. FW305-BF8]|uniref:hypothetical protein n=1 Tax=Arthrobacter sp. FW305-BF8 TaxID=2879617 RepID=UPI001F158B86|nr:hypothetical protein [Arthrobacter sp. FW305-BF8]UKA52937.1 hypothetical protein LFT45_14465 [Arthrobacter sp. FW305-BF8]
MSLIRLAASSPKSGPAITALAGLIFVVVAVVLGPGVVWADTVQYLRIAYTLQGVPVEQSWLDAYTLWCQHPSRPYTGTLDNCISTTMAGRGPIIGWIDRNAQYQEIFSPRIGYPLLSIPLMALFGDREGLWIVSVAATAIGGLIMARIARLVGLGLFSATAVQVAFYVLPVSLPHGVALLAEAATLTSALVMALGLVHVFKGSTIRGTILVSAGLALVFFFKYSSTLLLSVSFLAVCLGLVLVKSYRQRRQVRLAVFVTAACAVVSLGVNRLFGFPGLSHSLQDTFTDHFRLPPVDDPYLRLLMLEGDFLWKFILALPANALYVLVFAAAVTGYVLALRAKAIGPEAWVLAGLSLYGVLSVVAHPVYSQAERLGSSLWVGASLGLGLLLAEVRSRRKARQAASVDVPATDSL